MKPLFFIDFRVKRGLKSSECMMKFFRAMHSHFSDKPGKTAVAFPNSRTGDKKTVGNVLRIFAEDSDILESLIEFMNGQDIMNSFTRSVIALTPKTHDGEFDEYLFVRVPSARAITRRRTCLTEDAKENFFARRLAAISETDDLPFISMSSRSQNGSHFSLMFRKTKHSEGDTRAEIHPSNYGFSIPSRRFSLPSLPLLAQQSEKNG